MAYLNKAEKRIFAADTLEIIRNNSDLISQQGFKPDSLITELEHLFEEAKAAEARQLEAKVNLRNATIHSQNSLNNVYTKASSAIDIASGVLGKKHSLVRQLKKLRRW